jgi:lysophospholipase L1-like esterase
VSYRPKSEAMSIIPPRFTSRLLRIGKILAIHAAIVVFLLLLLEGAVRVTVPEVQPLGEDARLYVEHRYGTTHGYAANAQGLSLGAHFVTDQYGRRIVPGEPRRVRQRTLLFVGDSVSVGYGVEAENALPHVLERRLDDHRVVNAAVNAYTARDYANVLAALLPEIKPEGVIVGVCLNDWNSHWFVLPSRPQLVRPKDPVPSSLRYINDHVFDFNAILRRYSRLYVWMKSLRFDASARTFGYDRKLYSRPNEKTQIAEDLSRLKELAQDHNAWIEFFVFPYEYQLRSAEQVDRFPQQVIKAAASDAGVRVNNLHGAVADYLRASGKTSKSLYLFDDPMHFSPSGHDVVARLIQTRIATRLGQVAVRTD